MIALGIDTTGRGGAVALARADEVLGVQVHDPALGYAEELFGLLDELLERCALSRQQIDAVAVLSGPGSFTGLRIGVMTAKTLAFALDRPLLAAPTLDLIAAISGDGHKLALADAGGGHVWAREYQVGAGTVRALGEIVRAVPDELPSGPQRVSAAPLSLGTVIGDLAGPLARLTAAGSEPVHKADPLDLVPDYASLSQAERMHGLDLSEELRRPIKPRGWDT
ncbi:tRNA (adenosine(37)-N6)-threonylcarbamoyltransferase complex dimerization subunit type 1 TsaB [bacterium]|nr:MAG: tRNA (adenosine(37)-N6)-threonylcarbamoyltransferase complex dimerization subunit type 1 TsaB [bacterium]